VVSLGHLTTDALTAMADAMREGASLREARNLAYRRHLRLPPSEPNLEGMARDALEYLDKLLEDDRLRATLDKLVEHKDLLLPDTLEALREALHALSDRALSFRGKLG
jgi:hypothetical protein